AAVDRFQALAAAVIVFPAAGGSGCPRRCFVKLRLAFALLVSVALAITVGGCSCGDNGTHGGLGGGGDSSGSHHSTGPHQGGGGGVSTFASGTGSTCKTHCSSDLHDIVDC